MASHTTPQLSFDEEIRELTEMNEREWSELVKDRYGRNHNNSEDDTEIEEEDDIYEELLDDFFEEVEKIPLNSKSDYIEALIQVPEIVEAESNPILFLRALNYEPKDAAMGLCDYWKRRVEVFKDDAFKPLTLQGALKDVVNFIVDLPNIFRILPNDDCGRAVICYDRTNVRYADIDQMALVKYLWFVYHKALESESAQKEGVVFIAIERQVDMDNLKRNIIKLIICPCIPIRACSFHICCSSLSVRLLVPTVKLFSGKALRQRTELHSSLKTPTIIKDMEAFGLHGENLPTTIGGTYTEKPSWVHECEQIVNTNNIRRRRAKNERYRRRSFD